MYLFPICEPERDMGLITTKMEVVEGGHASIPYTPGTTRKGLNPLRSHDKRKPSSRNDSELIVIYSVLSLKGSYGQVS